jgi:hypothetical protein
MSLIKVLNKMEPSLEHFKHFTIPENIRKWEENFHSVLTKVDTGGIKINYNTYFTSFNHLSHTLL